MNGFPVCPHENVLAAVCVIELISKLSSSVFNVLYLVHPFGFRRIDADPANEPCTLNIASDEVCAAFVCMSNTNANLQLCDATGLIDPIVSSTASVFTIPTMSIEVNEILLPSRCDTPAPDVGIAKPPAGFITCPIPVVLATIRVSVIEESKYLCSIESKSALTLVVCDLPVNCCVFAGVFLRVLIATRFFFARRLHSLQN